MNTSRLNSFTDGVIAIIITSMAHMLATVVAFLWPYVAIAIYVAVAAMWLVPDKRFERLID
jgi:uncharacterized membrane protein